jgi:hypothetical protein
LSSGSACPMNWGMNKRGWSHRADTLHLTLGLTCHMRRDFNMEEAVMVGVAPQSPQSSPLFWILQRSVMRDRVNKCPARPRNSRRFPQSPAKSRRCPANSRNVRVSHHAASRKIPQVSCKILQVSRKVPQFGTCGTCGTLCGTLTPTHTRDPNFARFDQKRKK